MVFFFKTATGNDIIARTAWEIGERASISGIHRTPGGIDYPGTGVPGNDSGSAVLFVGRKEDKTLLAVGRLSHVDGAPSVRIKSDTKSVTFTVDALSAGVNETAASSSFLTDSKHATGGFANVSPVNTDVFAFNVAARVFPLYRLSTVTGAAARTTINATYTFGLASGAAFTSFGFFVAESPLFYEPVEWIEPRYTVAGNNIATGTTLVHDQKTVITLVNNTTKDSAFVNPVQFSFDISNTVNGSVFSLVFAVPVYALTASENPVRWFLRPGYGTYNYELDDGRNGPGGAVLIGTGGVEPYVDKRLIVKTLPTVTQTNGSAFNLQGAVIHLYSAENHTMIPDYVVPVNDTKLKVWVEGKEGDPVPTKRPFDVELRYTETLAGVTKTYRDFFIIW